MKEMNVLVLGGKGKTGRKVAEKLNCLGHVVLPRGEALVAYVDTDDIADVVVEAIIDNKHNGQVYDLTGPDLLTFPQVILEISKATGRELKFYQTTLAEYKATLEEYHVPEDYVWLIDFLFTHVLDGRNSSTTNDIEAVLGRKPKSFVTYVSETAEARVWDVES